jgi:hypothetical protein
MARPANGDTRRRTTYSQRIALLEAQHAAQTEQGQSGNEYTREEVYVADGTGICLHCSCEGFTQLPEGGDPRRCWGCNHDFGEHKRNPAGAQWKDG